MIQITRVVCDDLYPELTDKQLPSNSPILVGRQSLTCMTYRWKIVSPHMVDGDTWKSAQNIWKSDLFGRQWSIVFGDRGRVDSDGVAMISFYLYTPNEEGYVHYYVGNVNPFTHKLSLHVANEGMWFSDIHMCGRKSLGIPCFMSKRLFQDLMERDGMFLLEFGIETMPCRHADPKCRLSLPFDVPRLTLGGSIAPLDIFYCPVCKDVCKFDAMLCAAGQHTICMEHITSESMSLCGCCETSLKNSIPIPLILSRLYKTLAEKERRITTGDLPDDDGSTYMIPQVEGGLKSVTTSANFLP